MAEIHGPAGRFDRWNAVRASDAERNQVVELLQQHFVDGRLTSDDLTERIESVFKSQTRGELQRLLDDLPALASPAPEPATGRQRPSTARIVLLVIAAIALLSIAAEIMDGLAPLVVIVLVVWLVRRNRNRRQSSC